MNLNWKKWLGSLFVILSLLALVGCTLQVNPSNGLSPNNPPAVPMGFEEVAAYIAQHGELPDNFITKKEARKLGWEPEKGNLHKVAPGKSIGGDVFRNREGLLPKKEGRVWYEADINYQGGPRGSERILYSNDGLIYKTTDHYKTFTPIQLSDEGSNANSDY